MGSTRNPATPAHDEFTHEPLPPELEAMANGPALKPSDLPARTAEQEAAALAEREAVLASRDDRDDCTTTPAGALHAPAPRLAAEEEAGDDEASAPLAAGDADAAAGAEGGAPRRRRRRGGRGRRRGEGDGATAPGAATATAYTDAAPAPSALTSAPAPSVTTSAEVAPPDVAAAVAPLALAPVADASPAAAVAAEVTEAAIAAPAPAPLAPPPSEPVAAAPAVSGPAPIRDLPASAPRPVAEVPMAEWVPTEIEPAEGKTRFCELDIPREVLRATMDLGFKYCTAVQAQVLPLALAGRDITARAQTGTGKTAAFLLAALSKFSRNPLPNQRNGSARMLVLAPTRELAVQIGKDADNLSRHLNLNNLVIFGGMNHREQRRDLQRPVDIIAGTPGRILDFIGSGDLDLSRVETLVIDEADRMLDMGFIPDVRRIVARLPPTEKRQTMLFSATLDQAILRLVARWLNNPVTVEITPEKVVTDLVEESFYNVPAAHKLALLLHIVNHDQGTRVLVFTNRKDRADDLTHRLRRHAVPAELLSGDVPQKTRMQALERFREGTTKVIVATDVAARGIHVDGVTHVVNYDLPFEPEDYVHRVGRTGRAGVKGKAISFACEYGAYVIPELEKLIGRSINTIQPEEHMLVLPPVPPGTAPEEPRKHWAPRDQKFAPRRGSFGGGRGGGRR